MNQEQLIKILQELKGRFNILSFQEGLPIVFLFDEKHKNLISTEFNISNAIELIQKANVQLIGVESLAGGKEWDDESENYVQNDDNIKWYNKCLSEYKNDFTVFADELSTNYNEMIYGVESIGMIDKTELDVIEEYKNLNIEETRKYIKTHKLTFERSKHFIKTLIELYISKKLKGNLILNCGLDHNTHIEQWIKKNMIYKIINGDYSFVRLNTIE
jgi:hypothetical protein